MPANKVAARQAERLSALLAIAERNGAKVLVTVRSLAILTVYAFFLATNTWSNALFYAVSFSVPFLAAGFAAYYISVSAPRHRWAVYALGLADLLIVTYLIVSPNPFDPNPPFPAALHVREGKMQYLLLFVALSALTLTPRLVIFMGAAASLLWMLVIMWVLRQPGTISDLAIPGNFATRTDEVAFFLNPNFIDVTDQTEHIVVMAIVAATLATVVWRSRQFVLDYVGAERARSNLARHFSPNMIDEIANKDAPFGPVRKQNIGVLFADIVGFTKFSEEQPPELVFDLLRQFHQRMEQVVFQHRGTLDNYIGDCVMATFGVPKPTEQDALNAIACGIAMIEELSRWNAERANQNLPPVDARVGVHFGAVVLGEIGSERILSFAVIGDACNVASRLQALCRDVEADLCIGHGCLEAAAGNFAELASSLGLEDDGFHELRGRGGRIRVWKKSRVKMAAPKE